MKATSALMGALAAAAIVAAGVAPASAIDGPRDHASWADSGNGHNGIDYCAAGELAATFKFQRFGPAMDEDGRRITAGGGTFTIKNVSKRTCLVDGGMFVYSDRVPGAVNELDGPMQHTGGAIETGRMGLLTKNLPFTMTDYRDVALKPGKTTFMQISWEPGSGEGNRWARAFALVGGQNSFQARHGNIIIRDFPSGNQMNPLGIRSGSAYWHCPLGWDCLGGKPSGSVTPKPDPKPSTGPVTPKPKPNPCPKPRPSSSYR